MAAYTDAFPSNWFSYQDFNFVVDSNSNSNGNSNNESNIASNLAMTDLLNFGIDPSMTTLDQESWAIEQPEPAAMVPLENDALVSGAQFPLDLPPPPEFYNVQDAAFIAPDYPIYPIYPIYDPWNPFHAYLPQQHGDQTFGNFNDIYPIAGAPLVPAPGLWSFSHQPQVPEYQVAGSSSTSIMTGDRMQSSSLGKRKRGSPSSSTPASSFSSPSSSSPSLQITSSSSSPSLCHSSSSSVPSSSKSTTRQPRKEPVQSDKVPIRCLWDNCTYVGVPRDLWEHIVTDHLPHKRKVFNNPVLPFRCNWNDCPETGMLPQMMQHFRSTHKLELSRPEREGKELHEAYEDKTLHFGLGALPFV
ncbi:uncharacterized protein FIBRA_04188 [Fibroporia radiculosa]|uniref:Uncharacterized protein n=1 Tax=Fibroporia radiculosa TaxID=599839 RepID=J4IA13_9APHY|nr:uncharacterized protein FIBRA_04188 [Fibroporia radiculosa]CCM02111.1 predicted protein [Fibroporia radiculosa]